MKDAVLAQVGSAEWQTPRHGDFARYVEQLTGGQARVTLDEPGRVPRFSERAERLPRVPVKDARGGQLKRPILSASAHTPTELAVGRSSVASLLGAVRWGFLLITLVQLGLLVVLSLGSFVGVAASLLIWWLLGKVKRMFDSAGMDPNSRDSALDKVRREMQTRADEKRKQ